MLVGSQKDTWFNSHSVSLAWEDKTGNFLSKFTKITNSKRFFKFFNGEMSKHETLCSVNFTIFSLVPNVRGIMKR